MNLREFAKECSGHGFVRNGDSFYRCIGDGVFQMIYVGEKEKLMPDHPLYSPSHRYERDVAVYLKSIYGSYPDGIESTSYFSLSVKELDGTYGRPRRFDGSSAQFEKMCAEGFLHLDAIDTQKELEKFLFDWYNPEKEELRFNIATYDLSLYCGEYYKARMAVETLFASNCFGLFNNYERSKALSPNGIGFTDMQTQSLENYVFQNAGLEEYQYLYALAWPRSVYREQREKRLTDNRARNLARLKELGVDCSGC